MSIHDELMGIADATVRQMRYAADLLRHKSVPFVEADRAALASDIDAAADYIEALQARVVELEKQNDLLRAATGNNDKPCIYCGLDAAEMARCPDGFPGCGRADDKMLCPHFAAELNQAERAEAAEARADALAAERDLLKAQLKLSQENVATTADENAALREANDLKARAYNEVAAENERLRKEVKRLAKGEPVDFEEALQENKT